MRIAMVFIIFGGRKGKAPSNRGGFGYMLAYERTD